MQVNYKQAVDWEREPEFTVSVPTARNGGPLCKRQVPDKLQPRNAMLSLSRIMGLTKFLGVVLILTALSAPVNALGAVLPPGQSVTLAWDHSTDPNVAGYNIYYGDASRTYTSTVNPGTATSVTISGLVEGMTYFFAATSYDALGLESDWSSEISYTVPGGLPREAIPPSVQLRVTPTKQVILTVTGQVGNTYDIQATQNFKIWRVIGTVTVGVSGSSDFTDTNAAGFQKRFYRTQERP